MKWQTYERSHAGEYRVKVIATLGNSLATFNNLVEFKITIPDDCGSTTLLEVPQIEMFTSIRLGYATAPP